MYSLQIIKENIDKVAGLKFQSSILYNRELIQSFKSIDLSKKKLILNISGIELHEITKVLDDFRQYLDPEEIILQVGFQGYPTTIEDNGFNKINILKKHFDNKISFADHIDCNSENSLMLPIVASLHGAKYIEKHVCLEGEKPKYDHFSSMVIEKYQAFLDNQKIYLSLNDHEFINEKERKYLSTTIQMPTLKVDRKAGQNIDLNSDFEFRRSSKKGLRGHEIRELQEQFYILSKDVNASACLAQEDFKKANIAVIIACRLKSSRLPKKAVLKIGDLSSVEVCIKNALSLKNINSVILATSDLEEDAELVNYKYSDQVIFHKGDPEDVIERYLGIIEKLKIDTIVRVTADMPFISDEILQPLLRSHFQSGADYTRGNKASLGTNLEIINTQALRKVKSFFPSANYSEYMTYYFTNNRSHFRINEIDLPEDFVRNYRLTLDYEEDLILFNKIVEHLDENKLEKNLRNIIEYLDKNPEVAKINSGLEVKYFTDKTLIEKLNKYTTITA